MNLRKLELAGFKTFARRTELPLPGGVTAIIGPNGSGKSNLADALRWVLGEQSLQHLRSKKTEDVIFAGGGNRAQMGVAEVTLTLDNTSGWIPVDFSEVTLTRRAHRSGENEYFINGARVRLRDIVDLRNRAGFGQSSYSVIGQGLIDQVLSQRPDERRALFEEAAGIRHYQAKRDQTLEQLQATQQNVTRVNDIIAEIVPRLNSLRHQSEKTRQHTELTEQLRTLQILWFAARHRQLRTQVNDAERQLTQAQQALEAAAGHVREAEARTASLEAERQFVERGVNEQSQRLGELRRQKQQLQGQIDLVHDKLTFIEQQGADVDREIEEIARSRHSLQEELAALETERRQAEEAKSALELQLREAEQQSARSAAAVRDLQRQVQQAREELLQANGSLSQKQQQAADASRHKEDALAQVRKHEEDVLRKSGLIATLDEHLARMQQDVQGIRTDEEKLSGVVEEARLKVSATTQRLEEQRQGLEQLSRKRHELATKHQLLDELQANLEGLGEGARALLKSRRPGILGPLAERLRVSAGYERAIGAALGFKLQAVLVEGEAVAREVIGLLPKSGGTLAAGPFADAPSAIPDLPAGLTAALDVVSSSHPAVGVILRDVAVAPDLESALKHRCGAFRIATMEGDLVDSDGTITRHGQSAAEAVLKRQQALDDLSRELAGIDADIQRAKAMAGQLQGEAQQHRQELAQAEEKSREASHRRQQRLNEIRDILQQKQAAMAQVEWIQSLLKQVSTELKTLDNRQTALTAELDQLRERIPELRQAFERQEQQLTETQRTSQQKAELPGQLRVEVGLNRQRIEHLQNRIGAARQSLANAERQLQARQRRADERVGTLKQLQTELQGHQEQLRQTDARLAEEEGKLPPLRNRLATLEQELAQLRTADSAAREEQVEQDKRCYRFSFEAQRKRDEVDSLGSTLLDELQLTVDLLPDPAPGAPEPSKKEVDSLKARIAALGPVNPDALAEYEEVQQRHAFLTTQAADLEQAGTQLKAVIAELEELTDRQFRETFHAVEVQFQRYFQTMFNGGQVQLFMTDPEEISRSGIEIMAQPPGKRLQSLAALSGGERALVAASLLFAILTVKPVPFCLLDEVDAALDEANVTRFCQALRSLAERTQFVVITHNRETMATADALYGVSMSQDGVSRLVSMRLAKNSAAAADEEAGAELAAG